MFVYVFVKDGNINDILFVLQTCIFLFLFLHVSFISLLYVFGNLNQAEEK